MSREVHVRFCERPVVKFHRPTQPHRCATSRAGKFAMQVSTMKKRLRRALVATFAWCREHMHAPFEYQQQMLKAQLRGHYQYYGRPTDLCRLAKICHTGR